MKNNSKQYLQTVQVFVKEGVYYKIGLDVNFYISSS